MTPGRCLVLLSMLLAGCCATARAGRLLDDLRDQGRATGLSTLKFSGQSDLRFGDGGPAPTPLNFNVQDGTGGVSSFVALDLHLFVSAALSRRTKLFVKLLGTADDGGHVRVDAMTLTTRLGQGWPVLDAGRFTSAFGRFPQRFLPMDNPLIGEALLYTYASALPANQIPASPADLLSQRGKGLALRLAGYGATTEGQTFLSGAWFQNGVKFSGRRKKLRYVLAVTNEPVSGSSLFDVNDNKAVTAHVSYKPMLSLGLGISASRGAYLDHGIFESPAAAGVRLGGFPESSLGFDVDYNLGRFGFFGELVFKHWESPTIPGGLGASGFFVEPRYKVMPGLYIALRAEHLQFDSIPGGPWDFDVSRLELGAGYSIERDLRLKASYQWNYTGGALAVDPSDNVVQVQLVGAF